MDIQKLNQRYKEAEECDKPEFAESRSNVLLVSGDHYARRNQPYLNRVRNTPQLDQQTKVRLTKNHLQRIIKIYINNIVTSAPTVAFLAKNQAELQNQKSAELCQAIWLDSNKKVGWNNLVGQLAYDFVAIGESFVKVFWNPYKGRIIAYNQAVDNMGQPVFDQEGNPAEGEPQYSGELEIDRMYMFNMLRCPSAKSLRESPYLFHRKMVETKELKKMFPKAAQEGFIEETKDETFLVFDGTSPGIPSGKNQTMVREYYHKPCLEYPKGYFSISTEKGILAEGELPYGIFPILCVGWDEIPTKARHTSLVKPLRPPQLEINRTASKIAETQMTLGDDKLITQMGAKIAQGATFSGIRQVAVAGTPPTILPGRSGEQYFEYLQANIEEMYLLANLDLEMSEKADSGQMDATVLLFRSLRQKKNYALYVSKFEEYLVQIAELFIELARNYYDETHLVPAIGKSEYINIPEFKATSPMNYRVSVEAQSGDIETKMGKYLTIQNILQYVGSSMKPEDIGKLIKNLDYVNSDEMFDDFTINYDMAKNIILALDRGEMPAVRRYQDHAYIIQRLTSRMNKADYEVLPIQCKQNYERQLAEHEQAKAQEVQELQAAQAGLIPTSGYMVVCDIYAPDPNNPNSTKRARLPYDALNWLIERLQSQGNVTSGMADMPPAAQADIGKMSMQQTTPQASMAGGQ